MVDEKEVVLKFHKDNTEDDVELLTRKWLILAPLRVKNKEMSKIKSKNYSLCKKIWNYIDLTGIIL